MIGGLSAIYAAFYTAQSLEVHSEQKIVKNSFEMIAVLSTKEIAKLRHYLTDAFDHEEAKKKEFYKEIISKPNTHTALKTLLNLYENVSIAIQYGYVDEKIMHKALAFILPNIQDTFSEYTKQARTNNEDRRILLEVEKLANAWRCNKFLKTGETIPTEDCK